MRQKEIDHSKPLPSHTQLDYWECYAKIIIETFYPTQFQNLIIADKPDLRTSDSTFGIEVTSAILESNREAVELWSRIPCVEDGVANNYKERMKQLGVIYQGGVQSWPVQNYSSDNIKDTPIKYVINAFSKKLKKLNSGGYEELQQYSLFIHSEVWLTERHICSLLEELISLNSRMKKFSYVFLTTTEDFFRFDLIHGDYSVIRYGDFSAQQFDMAYEDRKMVEKGKKDDNT